MAKDRWPGNHILGLKETGHPTMDLGVHDFPFTEPTAHTSHLSNATYILQPFFLSDATLYQESIVLKINYPEAEIP